MGSSDEKKPVLILPAHLAREEILKRFNEYLEESGLQSKEFWKHFGGREKASMRIPMESISETVDVAVNYDNDWNFDLRMLITLVAPEDRKLFIDIASFVAEKYKNTKPAGQLTLRQFKAELALRLCQMEF